MTGDICPLHLGVTREYVRSIFGDPDDAGAVRRGEPQILKYGEVELHFEAGASGALVLIYMEDAGGTVRVSIPRLAGSLGPSGP